MARRTGYAALLTLTAPGMVRHRGKPGSPFYGEWCPCTGGDGTDLGVWNASHSARWNHLLTVMRRVHPDLEFFRAIEVQKRGALHDHVIVHTGRRIDQAWLWALVVHAGYGCQLDVQPIELGSAGGVRTVVYVSKYVTKACDLRDDVPWVGERVDKSTGVVTIGLVRAAYRTWSCSRAWGATMAEVRAVARAYAQMIATASDGTHTHIHTYAGVEPDRSASGIPPPVLV